MIICYKLFLNCRVTGPQKRVPHHDGSVGRICLLSSRLFSRKGKHRRHLSEVGTGSGTRKCTYLPLAIGKTFTGD